MSYWQGVKIIFYKKKYDRSIPHWYCSNKGGGGLVLCEKVIPFPQNLPSLL